MFVSVCLFVRSFTCVGLCISKMVGDSCSVPMDHQQEMAYSKSIGHMIDKLRDCCGQVALHSPGGSVIYANGNENGNIC